MLITKEASGLDEYREVVEIVLGIAGRTPQGLSRARGSYGQEECEH